jgi:hypothetical protein
LWENDFPSFFSSLETSKTIVGFQKNCLWKKHFPRFFSSLENLKTIAGFSNNYLWENDFPQFFSSLENSKTIAGFRVSNYGNVIFHHGKQQGQSTFPYLENDKNKHVFLKKNTCGKKALFPNVENIQNPQNFHRNST